MKPYIIGLTGGIASGKTVVGLVFERLGAHVIDADVISRRVVEPGSEGFKRLAAVFKDQTKDGSLDRRALREHVFGHSDRLKTLNDIMLPLIRQGIEKELNGLDCEVAVLIAPLLFESGLNGLCDVTVAVTAPEEIRLARLMSRDSVTPEIGLAMIAAQMPDDERTGKSDVTLINDGTVAELRDKAVTLYNELTERIP